MRNPIYSETAAYGHMGRKPQIVEKTFVSPDGKKVTKKVELFTWEKLDYVNKVKRHLEYNLSIFFVNPESSMFSGFFF
jgi:S-adenosylmethionine synthetase